LNPRDTVYLGHARPSVGEPVTSLRSIVEVVYSGTASANFRVFVHGPRICGYRGRGIRPTVGVQGSWLNVEQQVGF
jgi:hypothetical protein